MDLLTPKQHEKYETSLKYIYNKRLRRREMFGIMESDSVIEVDMSDSQGAILNQAAIIVKIKNAMFEAAARGTNFVLILHIPQYDGDLLKGIFDEVRPRNYRNFFFIDELIAYPINNALVPKYEICTKEMISNLVKTYSIRIENLPKLPLRDPMARWNSFEAGDVVKATTSDGRVSYRIVIYK